ncbi:uncharacterized protein PHALS_06763 [Plasmopara halstedii]|uniref:Uncharacterized protein n=1 Tax=Plasmopara halstedii TaxID=4781 RepID=A0A0P1B2K1_PLAHL|nr:uncharacterized protein PHALS_06763 [Plasmopara halstedii]CEG48973.1 hypothetical protein PHALS_06763 [Plasmopara halstedii]|eukprot:XP_024585342.1 hypothetical protein PHALS_06763 [Plasmopara halstedii]
MSGMPQGNRLRATTEKADVEDLSSVGSALGYCLFVEQLGACMLTGYYQYLEQ